LLVTDVDPVAHLTAWPYVKLPRRAGIWHSNVVSSDLDSSRPSASFGDRALAWLSCGLPFVVAVSRAASSGQWRDDVAAVRDLGLVGLGLGGGVTTTLTQLASLLPLGSVTYRAALVSCVALLVATRVLYALSRNALRTLDADGPKNASGAPRWLAPILASVATLIAGLSPAWQREATVGGGAMVATALALGSLAVALRVVHGADPTLGRGRQVVLLGLLFGGLLAESQTGALATALAVVAMLVIHRVVQGKKGGLIAPRRSLHVALGASVLVALLLFAPALIRPMAPEAWLNLGFTGSMGSLSGLDAAATRTTALSAWLVEIGLVSAVGAGVGVVAATIRRSGRWLAGPLCVYLLADVLFPARNAALIADDLLTPLRLLALGSLSLLSAVGVFAVVGALARMRLPTARPAAVLLVMFHVMLVALTSEESKRSSDRSEQFAAEEWSDVAVGGLRPAATIVVHDPALAFRAWASRVSRGDRPDVLIVPASLLGRGRLTADLAGRERAIEPVIRSYALTGVPGEFELSRLADVRPLFIEYQQGWSARIVKHLTVEGMWLEYAPQPLGKSDRKELRDASLGQIRRTLAVLEAPGHWDPATSKVVADALRRQARVMIDLGDRPLAGEFLTRGRELVPHEARATPASPYMAMARLDLELAAIQARTRQAPKTPRKRR